MTQLHQACIIGESMSATSPVPPRDLERVRCALIAVIEEIQSDIDLECPQLEGGTVPLDEVPDFDSIVVPVVTSLLAERTGIEIPDDMNIFVDQDGTVRSIDEVARTVFDLQRREPNSRVGVHE